MHDIKMYVCISIISFMFFFMTTNKKRQCYPLCFLHDDLRKTTVSPPMFYLINIDSVTPYIYFMTADKKTTELPLMFFPC